MKASSLFIYFFCSLTVVSVRSEDLAQIVSLAKEKNPDILAARQSWKVLRAQVGPSETWPNPTFTYVDETFPNGVEGMPGEKVKHYRIAQMVPFPGKLSGDARMKHHEALIAEAAYQAKLMEVVGEVKTKYYELALTDEKIGLADQSAQALKSVLQTAQSRLASGQSTTSDVFMAQMELRKMENALFQERQARTLVQIELNTLLDRPTDTAMGTAEAPKLVDLPLTLPQLQSLAKNNAPQYRAAAHETNHARAMLSRNRLEFAPDFDFMYERETAPIGPAGRQIGVGLTFPFWLRRPLGLYESAAEHFAEMQAVSKTMENMVLKMVHREYTEAVTHLTLARNYERDILPTAQSNLKITRDQYASGKGEFLRVLEALRAWIEAHDEYQNELYHYGEHWSLLERWVGKEISHADAQ